MTFNVMYLQAFALTADGNIQADDICIVGSGSVRLSSCRANSNEWSYSAGVGFANLMQYMLNI